MVCVKIKLMQKKSILIIFCSILVGFFGFFAFRVVWVHYEQSKEVFASVEIHKVLNPPQGSLIASVTNLSGEVEKEGRLDTKFHDITTQTTLLEGESLIASDSGSVNVAFNNNVNLSLSNNTELDYLNALPNALVVRQPTGTITYATSTITRPFSIRSLGLLTQLASQSNITIATDTNAQMVTVTINNGTATLAYSDQNDDTQVEKLAQGQTAIFDNNASTLTLQQ